MKPRHRALYVLTFVVSTVAVGLLSAALGTDYWVVARPIRLVDEATKGQAYNVTGGDLSTKFQGYIHFGLFRGLKELDHGLGVRREQIKVACSDDSTRCGWYVANRDPLSPQLNVTDQAADRELFNFGLWVSTIVFLVLSIVLGLTSMVFSALNAGMRPIETITGPLGIYLWNAIALVFACTSFILYLVLYFVDHRDNVLVTEDRVIYKWTSEGRAQLHFSFYLLVAAAVLYAGNICLMLLSRVQLSSTSYRHSDKALDGVMMY